MPLHESETCELKRSTAELEEALKSMVAILNKHQQGELYFGIKDNGEVIGQDVSDKTLRDIAQLANQKIEPRIFPEINRVRLEDKDCIHIEFHGLQAPYFYDGRGYLRTGTTNQQISIPEFRRILSEQNSKEWEKQLSEKHIEDVDRKTLRSFVHHANAEERIRFPYQNARTTLEKLKLIKNDQLLKAGEVLFCNDNTLEIQAAVFAGTDKLTFLDIRQIRGNMFDAEVKCRAYIMDHIDWRGLLAGDGRKEIPEIPIRALEEALVNSMAHRDYTTLKSNEIAVYKNRIEIYNPGIYLPTASPEQYVKGNEQSVQRNPLIADTLYLAGVIEKWGSGFKRMVDECEKAGVRVEFKKVETGFVVVFYRQKNGIESDQVPEKIPESTGKVPEKYQKIITVIVSEPEISRENLSEKTGLSAGTILSRLRWLMKKGLLRRVGPDKGGHWEIIKKP